MELLFIDTETGGLEPTEHSLLQLGLIACINGVEIGRKSISIKREAYKVTANAMRYNGLDIYEDVYKKGKEEEEAVKEIKEFIGRHFENKPILVGHNVSIDKYFMREMFKRVGEDMDKIISYRMIDTMSLLYGLYEARKIPKEACSSDGAFKYYGIEVKGRHTAIGDCEATVELYRKLVGEIRNGRKFRHL